LSAFISILGGLVFLLGLRLLLLALRTRQLPELLIGLFLTLLGPAGGLHLRLEQLPVIDDRGRGLVALSLLGITAGYVILCAFTYWTFRRGVGWARALVVILVAWLSASLYVEVNGAAFVADVEPRLIFVLPRLACLAWSTCEAVRCHRMMRRRLRFGLADPVVTNRFLLYALWTGTLGLLPALRVSARVLELSHVELAWRLPLLMFGLAAGVVMLVSMFLNFWPPKVYVRWLEARS
jgi:hypothetical protein